MKKSIVLCAAFFIIGAVKIEATETILYGGDRIVWEIDGEQVYIISAQKTLEDCQACQAPVDTHRLCIEQFGWFSVGGGEPHYWVNMGTICLEKQWGDTWGFAEVPRLNISGFHEINIEAGWVNIDSEFGTIIDGEEAKTYFLPAVCKEE